MLSPRASRTRHDSVMNALMLTFGLGVLVAIMMGMLLCIVVSK